MSLPRLMSSTRWSARSRKQNSLVAMQERIAAVAPANGLRRSYLSSAVIPYIDVSVLLIVGLLGIVDGMRIILTKTDTVGGAAAGGWIVLLGGFIILGSYKLPLQSRSQQDTLAAVGAGQLGPPLTALSMLFVYIASIEWLGYALSTMLFMVAYLRVFGRYNILRVVALSVAFALSSSWLWAKMDVMLPHGVLPWS